MEALARSVLASLGRGESAATALGRLGDPDPPKASDALLRALKHPDLTTSASVWLPCLLQTARPGFGAQCLEEIATRYRQARRRALDPASSPALPLVLGSSDFLARLLLRHPHWVEDLIDGLPAGPDSAVIEADWTAIRVAKYRGLLRIAARDLMERPFEQALSELSDLADRCLSAAILCTERETSISPPALLALGKLGGRELNFSSDVDLLCLYDSPPGPADLERNQELTRFIQVFKRHLEVPSEDGFGYRVDLDLRPEGRSGVLANSVDAARLYYETFGAEWERQMLIRLRFVAGAKSAGESFMQAIQPFVYRRLIDPAAIVAVHDMKTRIELERRRAGRDLEVDLKEGPGGIRDVEFLAQALQLFHGGRSPSVRTGNVLEGLASLRELGVLPDSAATTLAEAYLWLRRAEHCAQLVEEQQVCGFPRDTRAQLALARRMGYRDVEAENARSRLLDDWTGVRTEVRRHFNALVLKTDDE